MVGENLGTLEVTVSQIVVPTYMVLFMYCFWKEYIQSSALRNQRVHLVLLLVFLLGCALVFTSIYVQYTPLEFAIVYGVQGRYFIPILPALCYSLLSCKNAGMYKRVEMRAESVVGLLYLYILLLTLEGITIIDVRNYFEALY
jgi:uncharacterized membrane protein